MVYDCMDFSDIEKGKNIIIVGAGGTLSIYKDNILSWRICRGRNNSKTCDTLVCNNASRDSWLCLKCETELNYYKREGGNDDDQGGSNNPWEWE